MFSLSIQTRDESYPLVSSMMDVEDVVVEDVDVVAISDSGE